MIALSPAQSFGEKYFYGSHDCRQADGARSWRKPVTNFLIGFTCFLIGFTCESIPARAAEFYAAIKLARQQRGLALDENDLWVAATVLALGAKLVSRDSDFDGIPGLSVIAPV